MKRIAVLMIACMMMAVCLTGCGSDGGAKSANATEAPKTEQKVEIVDYVKNAMEASACLSDSVFFVAEDGALIVPEGYDNEYRRNEHLPVYAALPNVKRIVASSSCSAVYALTDEGDLYYMDQKIAEGVRDMVYATTNSNESGRLVTADGIYNIDLEAPERVNSNLRENYPENYRDVAGKTLSMYKGNMNFFNFKGEEKEKLTASVASISVDKHDYIALTETGRVFMDNNYGNSDEYETMEFFQWENMAVIGAAKVMGTGDNRNHVDTLTVAGIQADGTVLACGDYAEEILSWGPLAYITMRDGTIIGLTKEGTLKMTGQNAEKMARFVEEWTDIVGVKAGCETDVNIISAVDSKGNFYYLESTFRWNTESADIISPETGCKGNNVFYKYNPDGTVFVSDSETGAWIPFVKD